MTDLRRTFGRLVAAHRRRLSITQEELAERAGLSVDMISKVETGASGARFPAIERLSEALGVHPAELFTAQVVEGRVRNAQLAEINDILISLGDSDLAWIKGVITASVKAPSRP